MRQEIWIDDLCERPRKLAERREYVMFNGKTMEFGGVTLVTEDVAELANDVYAEENSEWRLIEVKES